MLVFGCSIMTPDVFARCAGRGIARAAESDSVVLTHAAAGSIARSYNLVLDEAARHDDLEAVVLVHEDAEIADPGFAAQVRAALADPRVGVVGCLGATGVASPAWWDGAVSWGASVLAPPELGGDEAAWVGRSSTAREVDTLYGVLLVLAPWTVRNLRFDESLGQLHGYDADLCRQVRAAGRTVVVEPLRVVHHHALALVDDAEVFAEEHMALAAKWDDDDPDWRSRARRAEAEAAAARLWRASRLLQASGQAREQDARLARVTQTASWRLTEPLRRLNARRRTRRAF